MVKNLFTSVNSSKIIVTKNCSPCKKKKEHNGNVYIEYCIYTFKNSFIPFACRHCSLALCKSYNRNKNKHTKKMKVKDVSDGVWGKRKCRVFCRRAWIEHTRQSFNCWSRWWKKCTSSRRQLKLLYKVTFTVIKRIQLNSKKLFGQSKCSLLLVSLRFT